MKLLILDLETDGIPNGERMPNILELGMLLFCTNTKRTLFQFSQLYKPYPDYVVDTKPRADGRKTAYEVNQISDEMITDCSPFMITENMMGIVRKTDAIVAHNGLMFDFKILKANGFNTDKLLIDTKLDLPHHDDLENRKLETFAYYHGIVNPYPHQALGDCDTLKHVILQYDVNEIVRKAERRTNR